MLMCDYAAMLQCAMRLCCDATGLVLTPQLISHLANRSKPIAISGNEFFIKLAFAD
jgi:hypothetical protein